MIVIDTNVLACLWIPGPRSEAAAKLLALDSRWVAPPLWRSEFRNVLATLLRAGQLSMEKARNVAARAEGQRRRGSRSSRRLLLAATKRCVFLTISTGGPASTPEQDGGGKRRARP